MKISSVLSKLRLSNIRSKSASISLIWKKQKTDCFEPNSTNSSHIKEGYLWRLREGFGSRWKKNYLVLSEEGMMFLTKKGNTTKPCKIVHILDVVSLMLEDFTGIRRTKAFGIRLQAKADSRSLLLRCRSEDERNDWITAVLTAKSASIVKQTT